MGRASDSDSGDDRRRRRKADRSSRDRRSPERRSDRSPERRSDRRAKSSDSDSSRRRGRKEKKEKKEKKRHSSRDRKRRHRSRSNSKSDEGEIREQKRPRGRTPPVALPQAARWQPPVMQPQQPQIPMQSQQQQQQPSWRQQMPDRPPQQQPSAFAASRAAAPRNGGGGGGGQQHEMRNYLRCAPCRSDASSEVAFVQHCNGAKHRRIAGRSGFAGLAPNAAGCVPRLMDAQLRSACRAFGQDPDGEAGGGIVDSDAFPGGLALYENSRPWAPPLQHVVVEDEARFLAKRIGEEVADDDEDDDDDDEEDAVDDVKDNGSADKVGWAATTQGRSRDPPPVPPSLQNGGPMAAQRQGLPVFEHRQVLLDALASLNGDAPCLLVEGETGSGKSTQVPQYILEDCASRGAACNIVVTQPRRIAAIGVAERICAERGERCGETVGFAIRGESKQSPRTALLFNTTGVALRRLQEDALDGVTHLIVDEVHERTLEADFLLLAVRRVVQLRRERGAEPLRVVLMSATMPVGSIRSYFGKDCPSVKFPGRTFPVAALYLEHALAVTRHVVDSRADWHRSSLASQRRAKQRGAPNDRGQEAEGAYREVRVLGDDVQRRFNNWPSGVGRAMQEMDEDALNIDLVVQLVSWFADTCRGNVDAAVSAISKSNDEDQRRSDDRPVRADDDERLAVLVFCSGTKEIDGVIQALQSTRCLQGDAQRQWLLPLHGGLSPDDQRKCFLNAPKGITKVVVATNVAETSVTIPDVGFVVDSGRVKEERYDAERHVASLDDVWISQASARQRRGRAGRVRAGLAVHLYPSDAPLRQQSEPEVRRVALEQLVLRIKALPEGLLEEGTAAAACAALPEPPEPAAVTGAAEMLIAIGALEEIGEGSAKRESLTQLGALLARLPVDVRLGKLAVLGACFGPAALDDALTVAAALANRSPFMAPVSNRDAADASKRGFIDQHAGASGCGCEASDLIATRNAYRAFEDLGDRDRYDFARQRFLSIKTLQAIASLKRQLLEGLSSASFVVQPGLRSSTIERMGRERGGTDGVRAALGLFEQRFAQTSNELLAGLIGAALYPQLAYVSAPPTKKGPCSADAVKLHVRDPDASRSEPQACSVHPSSVASKLGGAGWRTPYAAFHQRVKTTKLYVRDATPVPPLAPFVLAGARLRRSGDVLTLDDGLSVRVAPAGAAKLVQAARKRVDKRVTALIAESTNKQKQQLDDAQALYRAVDALVHQAPSAEPSSETMFLNVGGGGGKKRSGKKRSGKGRSGQRGRPAAGGGGAFWGGPGASVGW